MTAPDLRLRSPTAIHSSLEYPHVLASKTNEINNLPQRQGEVSSLGNFRKHAGSTVKPPGADLFFCETNPEAGPQALLRGCLREQCSQIPSEKADRIGGNEPQTFPKRLIFNVDS